MPSLRRALVLGLSLLLLAPAAATAAGVQALFDLSSPNGGPFPSNRFTVADDAHLTGLRVALPLPSCAARPSDCEDLAVINTLDGFNVQPRLSIPFSGAIDPATLTSANVFLVSLGDTVTGAGAGKVVGINQAVWDPATSTAHAESDELLDQHTRYALIVTNGVRDAFGDPVGAGDFARFRHDLNFGQTKDAALKAYRKSLLSALALAGVPPARVVAASVFTTQSATAVLEKIRHQIKATTPAPASFMIAAGAGGPTAAVFPVAGTTIVFTRQVGTNLASPASFTVSPLPTPALAIPGVGVVGTIAFGKYASPDYETAQKFIPAIGTRTGTPVPQAVNDVYFNLFLPAGSRPAAGWPVAIFGHGFGDNKNNSPLVVAASLAGQGIATIAINVVGHGGGPAGTLIVNPLSPSPVVVPAGGRGIDQNGDGAIDSTEGSSAAPPRTIIASRDGLRQTVVDLMQLVRVIETGGIPDLDPTRIYYFGQSFGGIYGTIFMGVEPSVLVGVPNVPGGAIIEIVRLSPVFRGLLTLALAGRTPALLNGPFPIALPFLGFNENLPLRDEAPRVNAVAGAMAIQEVIENSEWVSQSGNPVAYAPYIRRAPLDGMPVKSIIVQFARGDQTVPNPTATAILRAGDLADRATYFRNDLFIAANAALPAAILTPLKNAHTFLTRITGPAAPVAFGAQAQIAMFLATDGMLTIDPDPVPTLSGPINVFEVPIVPPLPETTNFIP